MNGTAYVLRLALLAFMKTPPKMSNELLLSRNDSKYMSVTADTNDKRSGRVKRGLVEVPESPTVQGSSFTAEIQSIPETTPADVQLLRKKATKTGNSTGYTTSENADHVGSENTTEDNLMVGNSAPSDEHEQSTIRGPYLGNMTEERGTTMSEGQQEGTVGQWTSIKEGIRSEETLEEDGTMMIGGQNPEETTLGMRATTLANEMGTATVRNTTVETSNEMETTTVVRNVTEERANEMETTVIGHNTEETSVPPSDKIVEGLYTQRVVEDIWYVCHGIFGTIFEIFGIFGNFLCMFVLRHPDMRSSTSILLRSLAVYDVMVLISYLFMVSLNQVFKHTDHFEGFKDYLYTPLFPVLFGLASLSFMGSYYTTVAISIERCLVVSVPLKAATWFSVARAKVVSGIILLFVFVYNIPRFMVFRYTSSWDKGKQRYVIMYEQTEFSRSQFYAYIYSVLMNIVCKVVIPLTILGISSCVMVRAVVKNSRIRKHLRSNSTSHHGRFTAMVTAIMVFSLLSLLTGATEVVLYRIHDGQSSGCAMVCGALSAVSELVAIINSSINFLLYCFFGSKFREVVKRFLPWIKTNNNSDGSRRTTSTQQQLDGSGSIA